MSRCTKIKIAFEKVNEGDNLSKSSLALILFCFEESSAYEGGCLVESEIVEGSR